MTIDPLKLAGLPRDVQLIIFETASGFTCVLCGVEAYPWAYRVRLPLKAGLACPGCAGDSGWEVK